MRAGGCRVDVLDQDGAGGGAVALPQLEPVVPSSADEEQRPVHGRSGSRGGNAGGLGGDDEEVAGLGAVALSTAVPVVGREEQRAVHRSRLTG